MSKQATLTSFFHARKALADGADAHVVKKRKLDVESTTGSWDVYGVESKARYPDQQEKFFEQVEDERTPLVLW